MDPRAQSKCEAGIIKSGIFTKKRGKFTTRVDLTFPTFFTPPEADRQPGGDEKGDYEPENAIFEPYIAGFCTHPRAPSPILARAEESLALWPSAHRMPYRYHTGLWGPFLG